MSRETKSTNQRDGRYSKGGITEEFPNRLGWWERRKLEKDESDITVAISKRSEGRPDLIAYQIYGDSYLSWLVLQYNSIVDPVEELSIGKKIRLPLPSRLQYSVLNGMIKTNV